MEQMHPASHSDNRLIINEEPNLQRLAAIVVAIELLSSNLHCNARLGREFHKSNVMAWWLRSRGTKMIEKLTIPRKIQDLLFDSLHLISSEIELWSKYHILHVFVQYNHNHSSFVKQNIHRFVWTSFGTIDYVKTAEKWIAAPNLSRLKYRLACLNCMRDTVENLFRENPAMADAENMFPLVRYWNSRMKGEVIDITLNVAPTYVPVWAHLLEQMSEDERYSFSAGRMLEFPARVVKELLPQFTEIEQRRLFSEKLPELMKLFVVDKYPQFAIQLWRYMGDNLSVQMYLDVFDTLSNLENCFGDDGTPLWLGELQMEMWRCAPDSLKEGMFHHKNGYFLCEWTLWFNCDIHCNLHNDMFLFEMLSDASAEFRRQFWMDNWGELAIGCDSKYFAKFIEACLPEPSDVDEFLKELENSMILRDILRKLCLDLRFDEITEFLDQFVRDTNLKADLKKLFVPSDNKLSEPLQLMGLWSNTSYFVDVGWNPIYS